MKIERLYKHPEKMGEAAEMIYDEFVSKKENPKSLDEVKKMFVDRAGDSLPIRLVAL